MIKTGNLFELAEKELQKEGKNYTLSDILNYTVKIRKWLDKNEEGFLKEERRLKHNKANRLYKIKRRGEKCL